MYVYKGKRNVDSSLPHYENEKLAHPGDVRERFVEFGVGVSVFHKALRGASLHCPCRLPRLTARSMGRKRLLPTSLIYFSFLSC